MTDDIRMKREDLMRALRQLEIIVPSLDRLGSASVGMSQSEFDRAVAAFLDDWDVFRRLSEARRILSEQFSYEPGPDGMDELEREFHELPHWTPNARKPPRDL